MAEARRIAYVVSNDVYRDSRVLKTADSAAAAGYVTRIYAFGGALSHYPSGVERRESGAEIHRLAVLPDRLRPVAAVLTRLRPPMPANAAEPVTRASVQRTGRLARAVARVRNGIIRWGMRLGGAVRERDFRRAAVREIVAWQPHLLHAHDANTLDIAMDVHRRTDTPFVYDAHELWEQRNARRGAIARKQERRLLDRATVEMAGSVTVSPSIQRWMTDRYGLANEPVLVRNIPHANSAPPSKEQGCLRTLTGIAADQHVIAYVGGITSGRGIEEAIAAMALLPPNHQLVLLGYGGQEHRASFEAIARNSGIVDRVHFAGSVESGEVAAAVADADVSLVYTQPTNLSYRFSLPNKLFESIHAGVPIVASDLPDVAALVRHYDLGELAPPNDVEALAAAILAVISDTERFRAGAMAAAVELSWQGEMERLLLLYREILEPPGEKAKS